MNYWSPSARSANQFHLEMDYGPWTWGWLSYSWSLRRHNYFIDGLLELWISETSTFTLMAWSPNWWIAVVFLQSSAVTSVFTVQSGRDNKTDSGPWLALHHFLWTKNETRNRSTMSPLPWRNGWRRPRIPIAVWRLIRQTFENKLVKKTLKSDHHCLTARLRAIARLFETWTVTEQRRVRIRLLKLSQIFLNTP